MNREIFHKLWYDESKLRRLCALSALASPRMSVFQREGLYGCDDKNFSQ